MFAVSTNFRIGGMMIKKLYVISFTLSLFFTNILFGMKKDSEGSPAAPDTAHATRTEHKTPVMSPDGVVIEMVSHDMMVLINKALRDFDLDPKLFRFIPSSEGLVSFDPDQKIVKVNEVGVHEPNQSEWAASFIAIYIYRFINMGKKPRAQDLFSDTYSYLFKQDKHTAIVQRISALATMMVMGNTAAMVMGELVFIRNYLGPLGYAITIALSKHKKERRCLLVSTITKNGSRSNFQQVQILPKIPEAYNTYNPRVESLQKTVADVTGGCAIL